MGYKNKEEQNACQRRWYRRNKKQVRQIHIGQNERRRAWYEKFKKTLKCSRCPENHPACLDFHHRDPKAKEVTIASTLGNGWSIARILKEIAKCDLLCANCHRKLHHECGDVGQRRLRLAAAATPPRCKRGTHVVNNAGSIPAVFTKN